MNLYPLTAGLSDYYVSVVEKKYMLSIYEKNTRHDVFHMPLVSSCNG